MSLEHIIRIGFRFINFAALLGLIWFLFKKYMLPYIKTQMHAQDSQETQLRAMHTLLKKDMRAVEQAIVRDQEEQEYLKERIVLWKKQVDAKFARLKSHRDLRIVLLQKRLAAQIKQIQQNQLNEHVLPNAIKQARAQLAQQFRQTNSQEQFMKELMRSLQSRG
jgi:type II secretory pathway component PulJ